MGVLLVTYDLNRSGQNYADLLKAIKAYDGWARLSESSYAIHTNSVVDAVFRDLARFLDKNDNLYVIELGRQWQGHGLVDVNQWLSSNL